LARYSLCLGKVELPGYGFSDEEWPFYDELKKFEFELFSEFGIEFIVLFIYFNSGFLL